MDSEVIQKLAKLSSGRGEVMFVESGYEQLMKKTIMWKIDNFVVGTPRQSFSEQDMPLKIEHGRLKGTLWTFQLFPTPGSKTVLQCSNEFNDEEKSTEHLLYSVKATIHGSRTKEVHKSILTKFGEMSYIFSINKYNLDNYGLLSESGSLILEVTVKVLSKKATVVTSGSIDDVSAGLSNSSLLPKTKFGHFLNSKEYCDVKIYSGDGHEFDAHKIILRAENEVFDVMFKSGMTEASTGIIKLVDLSAASVRFLLRFLYDGDILPCTMNGEKVEGVFRQTDGTSAEENTLVPVDEVLYVASKYELGEVLAHVDRSFRCMCREENVEKLLKLSKMYSLDCKEFLKNFMMRHPHMLDKLLDH